MQAGDLRGIPTKPGAADFPVPADFPVAADFPGAVLSTLAACRGRGGSLAPWKCEGKLQEKRERFRAGTGTSLQRGVESPEGCKNPEGCTKTPAHLPGCGFQLWERPFGQVDRAGYQRGED